MNKSFYNYLKILNIFSDYNVNELKLDELKKKCKKISEYINFDINKSKKEILIQTLNGIKNYIDTQNNNFEYFFNENKIILDEQQKLVVNADINKNLRIIAGAGSGKTTTILCKIKYMLDNLITPERILILTFNKDASINIKNRLKDIFGFELKLNIYTIDAFCCNLYYNYGRYLNLSRFISISEYSNFGLKIMEKFGKYISQQYKYVFFDEFQDVNDIQFKILYYFYANNSKLTVIGDDSQNIYQFRGTNNYYIINFDKIFDDTITYFLTTNYRSNIKIVSLSNKSISFNNIKVEKKMISLNKDNNSFTPKIIMCKNEEVQINYLIKKIKKFIQVGFNYDQISVLSRNSKYLKIAETEFTKHNIPHIALITDKNLEDNKKLIEKGKIPITTIHKSKGLEWEVVFLLGFEHKRFPEHINNNIKNIEEERRLFYVAVSRAKEYLFFIVSESELPLSCFLKETFNNCLFKNYPRGYKFKKINKLFCDGFLETSLKETYGVNEIITLFTPIDYDNLRNINLLPNDIDIQKIIHFENKFFFNEVIKKGIYEADFGEYVDRYITYMLIINNKEKFYDFDTENVLNGSIDKKNLNKEYNDLYFNNNYNYPSFIIEFLKNAYFRLQNNIYDNLEKDIYYISLCRNFNNKRRRLIYRDISDDIIKNINDYQNIDKKASITKDVKYQESIKERIEKYIQDNKNKKIDCKKLVRHKFTIDNKDYNICGEIDLVCIQENKIIDIKCSESEYKIEWLLQLLIYYSLFVKENKQKIYNLEIFNILDGSSYIYKINDNYECNKLIKYIENTIKNDHNGIRVNPSIEIKSFKNINILTHNNSIKNIINLENNNKNYKMIIDTETTSFYGDIIQIAYFICDLNNKIIHKKNFFIKDRLSTYDSYLIHKIDFNKSEKGNDFFVVISEFIKDLSLVNTVIGHNLKYDISVINRNIKKYDIIVVDKNKNIIYDVFDSKEKICTMNILKMTLEKTYNSITNKKIIDAHDAFNDVEATFECYKSIKSL